MSVQVSEAEEQEQLQVDSIKEQEGFLTQAKRAAALARWRRLQASLLIMSRGMHSTFAIVLSNPNTKVMRYVNLSMMLASSILPVGSNAFLPKLTLKPPVSILFCSPLDWHCCSTVALAGIQCTLVSSGLHTFAEQHARPGSPSRGGSGFRQI